MKICWKIIELWSLKNSILLSSLPCLLLSTKEYLKHFERKLPLFREFKLTMKLCKKTDRLFTFFKMLATLLNGRMLFYNMSIRGVRQSLEIFNLAFFKLMQYPAWTSMIQYFNLITLNTFIVRQTLWVEFQWKNLLSVYYYSLSSLEHQKVPESAGNFVSQI